jgi:hypothetical protein
VIMLDDMKPALLRCPFCGGEAGIRPLSVVCSTPHTPESVRREMGYENHGTPTCQTCGATIGQGFVAGDALAARIKAWNQRC